MTSGLGNERSSRAWFARSTSYVALLQRRHQLTATRTLLVAERGVTANDEARKLLTAREHNQFTFGICPRFRREARHIPLAEASLRRDLVQVLSEELKEASARHVPQAARYK